MLCYHLVLCVRREIMKCACQWICLQEHGWHVNAKDIFNYGFDKPSNTINKLGSNVRAVNMNTIPGLNTLDISMARIDFAPRGLNPPHTHPRATEILTVLEGEFYVGFVTSNIGQTNCFFTIF
ncbi:hypothetical protein ZIOFF_046878 [Zingiber officinale]|uniref:Cupin type-1 domain-containing protein n=1 Tax=Zingiber officinale TaxID=94328 RepID=A0A8J5FWU0_ZINOF|nr:hypothetical protein ZIOFF_046878 [Zingiber officinale]